MPMTPPGTNNDFSHRDELLAGLVLGNLSADEASCCPVVEQLPAEEQMLLKTLIVTHSRLEQAAAPPLSVAVRERLLRSARRSNSLKPQHWLIGGLFFILAVTGGELYRSKMQLASLQLETPSSRLHSGDYAVLLQATQAGEMQNAHGEVIIRPGQASNLLTLNQLPPAPEGRLYRLWAVTPDGVKGCVHFLPDKGGNVVMTIPPQPTGSAVKLLISVDPLSSRQSLDAQPERTVLSGAV